MEGGTATTIAAVSQRQKSDCLVTHFIRPKNDRLAAARVANRQSDAYLADSGAIPPSAGCAVRGAGATWIIPSVNVRAHDASIPSRPAVTIR